MNFDELMNKSTKAVKDGADKVDEARKSEKAAKVRDDIVGGFDKVMRALLPGEHKKKAEEAAQRAVEGGDTVPAKELPSK